MDERRQHPRLAIPIQGSWRGASGGSQCRIADVSAGGCFVQSLG
ncbi:MAG: PilZ domain-containing protein, partial [Gemmatimonadaceae bacterium]